MCEYEQEIHKIGEYEQEVHKIGEYEQAIHKIGEYEQETHRSHGNELKNLKNAYKMKDCIPRNRVTRPNVMTHSCNQLLRNQLTPTEFLLKQERSRFPCHVSDPEPSLIKLAESVISKRQERTVIRSSPRRSHQSNGAFENYQKQLQGQVRTMLAALQERTQYRPTTDSALMKWIVRHAAWLIPRFRGNDVKSPFYRAVGGPYRGKLLEFGDSVLAHLPEVEKRIWESCTEAG